jgi:LmbE family N-acetylglucosaminyl deacetylase
MGEKMKRVLVVGAHPDDEAYGPGGTIARMTMLKEWAVKAMCFTDGVNVPYDKVDEIYKQQKKSYEILGIPSYVIKRYTDQQLDRLPFRQLIHDIQELILEWKPEIVITHSGNDLNRDHRLVSEATLVACRPKPHSSVKEVWEYEVPSSTDWAFGKFGSFEPNLFVELHPKFKHMKIDAIQCYKNEIEDWPHTRSIASMFNLMEKRGTKIGVENAEAFRIVYRII